MDLTAWDRARRWRPTRRGVVVAGMLLVSLTVLVLSTPPRSGYLDPASVDPAGSRAVANVLRDLGVTVTDVRLTADVARNARGATVLVTDPSVPTGAMVDQVLAAGPRRVLLVGGIPGMPVVDRLAAGVGLAEPAGDDPLEPACRFPAAARAGSALLPGLRYDARAWASAGAACFDRPEAASVVVLPARSGLPEVVLLGSPDPLTNDRFDEEGNAALAVNLLGANDRLVWWQPTPSDPLRGAGGSQELTDLLPAWVVPVLLQVGVACLLVVWWRGRRLGPLVIEPLPVVVRAGETTAGRARLLHAHHARGEAAEHLRSAAREQVRVRLGLALGCSPTRLVHAAAARTARPATTVGVLLYGPEPADDAQLTALGHDLEALMHEVGGA